MRRNRRTTRPITQKQSILQHIDPRIVEHSATLETMKGLNQGKTNSMITFYCNGFRRSNQDTF